MPPSLPHLSGTDVVRALEKPGFTTARQKGSHIVMRRDAIGCVVPNHKEIKFGALSGILKQAGVSYESFMSALKS